MILVFHYLNQKTNPLMILVVLYSIQNTILILAPHLYKINMKANMETNMTMNQ